LHDRAKGKRDSGLGALGDDEASYVDPEPSRL
jgi:hypothetical protein